MINSICHIYAGCLA